ncbi:MAG: amidase [Alphaproteobacteria bacterium]|jgi:amidase|nr:amidase [Alphaproteobacteria bacterium]PPR13870.1 MAG: Biuret hydrolase [Alphaproteobacteria bacterium MarineAlpha12_Bin1]|tara:strand:- start:6422 stop:7636 length:1215 start_codon:yes stop_codon:yes gene_type:complete
MDDPIGAFVPHGKFIIEDKNRKKSGALSGLTFAAKDIIDVEGHITGCGNPDWLRTHEKALRTAPCIRRLIEAGATLVGKTVTEELATGLTGENIHYGAPINVNAPGRVSGGSSSGSAAAVAAGLVDFSLGSDTGGSVRAPASFCGIYGVRPTHGRVSMQGVMKLAPSFDVIGWFSRDPILLREIGTVLFDQLNPAPSHGKFLVAEDVMELLDNNVRDELMKAIDIASKLLGPSTLVRVSDLEGIPGLDKWVNVTRAIWGGEAWDVHKEWISSVKPRFGSGVAARFTARSKVTASEIEIARLQRDVISKHLVELLSGGNILALPAAPGIAPLVGGSDLEIDPFREANEPIGCSSGLAGLPQISLPLTSFEGVPLGLGLAAAPGNDELLLDLAVSMAENNITPPIK